MSGARASVLVVAADGDRAERYADWASERWVVDAVSGAERAVASVNGDTEVVVVAGTPPDASLNGVVGRIRAGEHDPQVVAVVDDPDVEVAHGRADDLLVAPVDRRTLLDCLDRVIERATYDERLREYYALASKKAVLEARNPAHELAESREYARLVERTERRREQVDELLAEISASDGYSPVFRGLFPGTAAGK